MASSTRPHGAEQLAGVPELQSTEPSVGQHVVVRLLMALE
jgi:hypothetical protein